MEEIKNLRVGYSRRTGFLHRASLFPNDIYIYMYIYYIYMYVCVCIYIYKASSSENFGTFRREPLALFQVSEVPVLRFSGEPWSGRV